MMVKDNSIKILLSYVAGVILLNIILAVYIMIFDGYGYFESAMSNLLFYSLFLILAIWLGFDYIKSQIKDFQKRSKSVLLYIGIGIGTIFGASMLVGLIYTLLDFTDQANNQEVWESIIASGTFGMVSTVVISVLFAPIVEEFVFRYGGFGLIKRFNLPEKVYPIVVIVSTSLMFGLIHILGDNPLQGLFYSALGAVLGFFYYKSNNIFVPIAIHMIWNTIGVLTMVYA